MQAMSFNFALAQ